MRISLYLASAAVSFGLSASGAWANHPVLVEGNCDSPVPGTSIVTQGTCGDFDGDGRIGTAEDTDGADRIFGTISAALGPGTGASAGTGANGNGLITIVKSGRFAEQVNIVATGNVTLEAAPGVEALIDAVLQGDPAGNNTPRQGLAGVVIYAPGKTRTVTLRNLTIRNWKIGIDIANSEAATLIDVRVSNCVNYGILVRGPSKVAVNKSEITATGFRVGTTTSPTPTTPVPGAGIAFTETSSGAIFHTLIVGSFGAGVLDQSTGAVTLVDVARFSNNPN